MKTNNVLFAVLLSAVTVIPAQNMLAQNVYHPEIQYFRPNDLRGMNMFESPKGDTVSYNGLKVRVGGDFAIIFQGLSQSNDLVGDTLVDLTGNVALPSANLNLDVQLLDGVRVHLRTYLASRHHNEAWVKGGFLQVDNLNFVREGFMDWLMKMATLRIGMDEINYGDAHFRRSDNARGIFNPFVGNYIMDAFTTEPFFELTLQRSGWLGVLGISNGKLNQAPVEGDGGAVLFGKLGYDKQFNDDLRVRLTGSFYNSSSGSTRDYLYNGDRAGARYYNVLEGRNDQRVSDFLPRFDPRFAYQTAFQFNPFVKYKSLEFFGIVETVSNGDDEVEGGYTHLGAELIYRFGGKDQLYLASRYNSVSGEAADNAPTQEIDRFHVGGGWFLSKNILTKVEYVTSSYDGDGWTQKFQGAEFDGIVIEAVISF